MATVYHQPDVNNAIVFTQATTVNISDAAKATDLLNLLSDLTENLKYLNIKDILELVDSITTTNVPIFKVTSDQLSLTDTVVTIGAKYATAETVLELTSVVKITLWTRSVTSELELSDYVNVRRPINVSANNTLSLSDQTTVSSILTFNIIDYLHFNKATGAAIAVDTSTSNFINFQQLVENSKFEYNIDTISFSQLVVVNSLKQVSNTLNLTQTSNNDGIYGKVASTTLTLNSVVSPIILNFCLDSPLRRSTTVLTYPYVDPIDTIELRNPNYDNVEQFEFRKINRRSRGGTLQVYRDNAWPQAERLIMTFSGLKQTDVKHLMSFINRSLGQEIGLLDFESRQWRGIILTPSAQTSEPSRQGFSASIEFEGTVA